MKVSEMTLEELEQEILEGRDDQKPSHAQFSATEVAQFVQRYLKKQLPKNGIIIDGDIYEVQEVDRKLIDGDDVCNVCDVCDL